MQCSSCGYMMTPFEKECPRCLLVKGRDAGLSTALVQTLAPSISLHCPECHETNPPWMDNCYICGRELSKEDAPSRTPDLSQTANFTHTSAETATHKICPRCGMVHILDACVCDQCGRGFHTSFSPRPPRFSSAMVNQGPIATSPFAHYLEKCGFSWTYFLVMIFLLALGQILVHSLNHAPASTSASENDYSSESASELFNKIHEGMKVDDMVIAIGQPDKVQKSSDDGDFWYYDRPDGDLQVHIEGDPAYVSDYQTY